MAGRSGGGAGTLVLMALVVALAAGGFNYWRNLQAEVADEGARPYAGYDDAEVAALLEAYGGQVEQLDARHAEANATRVGSASRGAHISDHVEAFERAQRHGDEVRQRAADAGQQQGVLRELEREQRLRSSAGEGFEVHLRRLTKL